MEKTSKCLSLIEKICFILGGIAFFVSLFLPLFAYKNGDVTIVNYIEAVESVAYLFTVVVFVIGFILMIFGGKKHFALSNALSLSSILVTIGALLSNMVSYSSSSIQVRIRIGGVFLFVSAGLYLAAYILHAIVALLNKDKNPLSVDERIKAVKDYKQYLDEGIITSEEYEAKKNEILGLDKKETKK